MKLRVFFGLASALACLAGAGCRQDMYDQPRHEPLEQSSFFENGAASRPPPPGVVAQGELREDGHLHTGMRDGKLAETFPISMDLNALRRGRERYEIYCAPCHGATGEGNGMVVQRGFPAPPSFHIERLRNAPIGHLFDAITRGYGVMYSYAHHLDAEDRWAAAAYIRALQFSRNASLEDVPESKRSELGQGQGAP